jgi:hypothetical protein
MTMTPPRRFRCHRRYASAILMAIALLAQPLPGQIRVNPTGVNVSSQSATTVFLTFGGLGGTYRAVEALWCGELESAAPDVGNRCNPATVYGRLPLQYNRSQLAPGVLTDVMSIPASVARQAYDAAVRGENSSFFYVRRFVGSIGQPDQYVSVTCRMAGGGARVPLALTDVRLSFETGVPVLLVDAGGTPSAVKAEIAYNGTGRLIGRWEIIRPGDEMPETKDLLTEATLAPSDRGTQRRFEELSRFNVFLPPTGRVTLRGPDPSRLPTVGEGTYLILLRIEVSDDKEGDSNLAAVGAGSSTVHSGAVAGFPLPTLRYVVGTSSTSPTTGVNAFRLLAPAADAHITTGQQVTFAWSVQANVKMYRLEVETLDGERVLEAYAPDESRRYQPPSWLLERANGRPLRWRVLALGADGRTVARTAWRALLTD